MSTNVDANEIAKFSSQAHHWWDAQSEFKPLHDINPLRLEYINRFAQGLKGQTVCDIGCGGGLVSEALSSYGATVTGIDLSEKALGVAKLHALESGAKVNYQLISAEALAQQSSAAFDGVSCLEMLEHVPDPAAIVYAVGALLKPNGWAMFSTIHRRPKAYAQAVLGAEYLLNIVPKGTHDYAKLLKPSELAGFIRAAGMTVVEIKGLDYNPFTGQAKLSNDPSVNYFIAARKN